MVANIWTPSSDVESLQAEFREEITAMLKKVSVEHNVPVEELKFTANSAGIINIQRMTPEEILEEQAKLSVKSNIKRYRKLKGL